MATNVRLSGAQTSGRSESDLRFNYNDLSQVIAASNNNGGATQAQFYSSDGGATWSQASLPAVTGDSFQSDPAVDWTSDGTAWALTVGVGTSNNVVRSFKSTDGGADVDVRREDLRLPEQRRQAEPVDRPQPGVAAPGQHVRALVEQRPDIRRAPRRSWR